MQLGALSCLSQALLAPILGARGAKAVSKVGLVGLCEPLRNMRLHVQNAHRAPFPGAQKQDRKRDMSKARQNCTEGAPGECWRCAKELQEHSREPKRRPNGCQRAPQRIIVAPWLCPSVLEPTLWMVSLRNVRSDPKLHSMSQTVPREGRAPPRKPNRVQRGA